MEKEHIQTEEAIYRKKQQFDKRKECTLRTYSHRFLHYDDPGWELLKEKLIHMQEVDGKKKSVQLCINCMGIFKNEFTQRHTTISVGSIFFLIDPKAKTGREIAKFLKMHGRWKKGKNGEIRVCFPAFNTECDADFPFLVGSQTGRLSMR